jgi:hypothetical protein
MQSSVFAFILIDVDGDFLDQAQRPAIYGLEAFEVGRKNIVGLTGRNALRELAHMVGVDLPAGLLGFIGGTADLHWDAVDRAVVRSPDRAGDESVRLAFLISGEQPLPRTECGQKKRKEEEDYDQRKAEDREPWENPRQNLDWTFLSQILLGWTLLR